MSLGGEMGSSSGTEKREPWDQQIPYILKGFRETDRLYGGHPATLENQGPTAGSGVPGSSGGYSSPDQEGYMQWQTAQNELTPWEQTSIPQSQWKETARRRIAQREAAAGGDVPLGEPTAADGYGGIVPRYYEGSTVADLSADTILGQDLARDNALSAYGHLTQARDRASEVGEGRFLTGPDGFQSYNDKMGGVDDLGMRTASGGMLGGNQYLDAMFDRASDSVSDRFRSDMKDAQSAFARSGRYGSDSLRDVEAEREEQLGRELSGLATDIYGEDYARERQLMERAQGRLSDAYRSDNSRDLTAYQSERDRMMRALRLSPELAAGGAEAFDPLLESGEYQDKYAQDLVNADIDRWDYEENIPYTALTRYMGLIQGDYGGTTSSRSKKSGFSFNLPLL